MPEFDPFKADETLDFHNRLIADVALGTKCKNSDKSLAYILNSPLGHIYTNACPDGLHCVKLYGDTSYDDIKWDTKVEFIRASALLAGNKHVKNLKKWLQLYFSNPLKCEDVELSFCGLKEYGDFNSAVWMAIKNTCPPGELMSYKELAIRSGSGPGASKVVGWAINKNPYMLVVGDHRVVTASGEIWCENESQRNKLRRLLVHYEIPFTGKTLDQALLEVKERNASNKTTRRKAGSVKKEAKKGTRGASRTKIKKETATKKRAAPKRGRKKKEETSDEDDDDDDDFIDDESDD